MTPSRESVILKDIEAAPDWRWLCGFVRGLKDQGEMTGPIPAAVIAKVKAEGWEMVRDPFPDLTDERKAA